MIHDPIIPGRARQYAGCLTDCERELHAYVAAYRVMPTQPVPFAEPADDAWRRDAEDCADYRAWVL